MTEATPGRPRVFCVGMQRSGTNSTGAFCERELGMERRGWDTSRRRRWSQLWMAGRLQEVFDDPLFRSGQAFHDGPWWYPGVYEQLFETFPEARFLLFIRDPDAWFRSLMAHSRGRSPGPTELHARIYGREADYAALVASHEGDPSELRNNGFALEGQAEFYKAAYCRHVEKVLSFFERRAPERLFAVPLEDPDKFRKMAVFLGYPDRAYPEFHYGAIATRPAS